MTKRTSDLIDAWIREGLDEHEAGKLREKLDGGGLPPWKPEGKFDQMWMEAWTICKINEEEDREVEEILADPNFDPPLRSPGWDAEVYAVSCAEYEGNIEPLREYVRKNAPNLMRYISLPKRKKGERFYPRMAHDFPAYLACIYVYRIRDLWMKTYNKKNRTDVKPTAVEIAARICDVRTVNVENALNRFPRKLCYRRPPARVRPEQRRR